MSQHGSVHLIWGTTCRNEVSDLCTVGVSRAVDAWCRNVVTGDRLWTGRSTAFSRREMSPALVVIAKMLSLHPALAVRGLRILGSVM